MKIKDIPFMKPIVTQWPLMLAYIVLIGWVSVTKNPIPRWMLIFLHAYLVASLVTIRKSKVVKALVYIVIYVLFTMEITLQWIFGMSISPNVITLLVETNTRESKEFLESLLDKSQLWQIPLCVVCMAVLNIIAEKNAQRVRHWIKGRKLIMTLKTVTVILLLGGVVFTYNYVKLFRCNEMNQVDEWRSHMRNPDDLVTKVVVSFYDMQIAEKEMSRVITMAEQVEAQPQPTNDSLNVIIVIGESYIREHAGLYGYPLQTTPLLAKEQEEGRLFVFTDMVSPYNQTTRVIRNLLSCNSLGTPKTGLPPHPSRPSTRKTATMWPSTTTRRTTTWALSSLTPSTPISTTPASSRPAITRPTIALSNTTEKSWTITRRSRRKRLSVSCSSTCLVSMSVSNIVIPMTLPVSRPIALISGKSPG